MKTQRLAIDDVMKEVKVLSKDGAPIKLRNAGRSLCDGFKLFLGELGSAIYGSDFVSNLGISIRFAFIVQHLPELRIYSDLAKKLDKPRNRIEHSDVFFPSKEELALLIPRADSLFEQLTTLIEKLRSKDVFVDLKAQRKLLVFFLRWLADELDGYAQAHMSILRREPPEEEIKKAKELISVKSKIDEMSLDDINDLLNEVRQVISEIDGAWSELSDFIEAEASTA